MSGTLSTHRTVACPGRLGVLAPPSWTVCLAEPGSHVFIPPDSEAVPPSGPQTLSACPAWAGHTHPTPMPQTTRRPDSSPSWCPWCSPCHELVYPCLLLTSPSPTLSVTSRTTSAASPCSSGTQAQHAEDPHKSSPQSAAGSTRWFSTKPATTFRTSLTSSKLTLFNKDTFEPGAAVFPHH